MNRHGEKYKCGGYFFYNDRSDKKRGKVFAGRAKDEAKVRKAVPRVTCAGADARVWITSAALTKQMWIVGVRRV